MRTSENSTSSTFGEYAKRAAPWEGTRPSRCSAGRFYSAALPLYTPSSLTPHARPESHGPSKAPSISFKPTRHPSWPLRLPRRFCWLHCFTLLTFHLTVGPISPSLDIRARLHASLAPPGSKSSQHAVRA